MARHRLSLTTGISVYCRISEGDPPSLVVPHPDTRHISESQMKRKWKNTRQPKNNNKLTCKTFCGWGSFMRKSHRSWNSALVAVMPGKQQADWRPRVLQVSAKQRRSRRWSLNLQQRSYIQPLIQTIRRRTCRFNKAFGLHSYSTVNNNNEKYEARGHTVV